MILCDTGPLLAIIDKRDPDHARCIETFRALTDRDLVTTWPCITEAMYLLGAHGGWTFQQELWTLWESRWLTVHVPSELIEPRLRVLMEKYRDRPMDFADASLVALAKDLDTRRIFTLDSDFRFYRTEDGGTFDILPE